MAQPLHSRVGAQGRLRRAALAAGLMIILMGAGAQRAMGPLAAWKGSSRRSAATRSSPPRCGLYSPTWIPYRIGRALAAAAPAALAPAVPAASATAARRRLLPRLHLTLRPRFHGRLHPIASQRRSWHTSGPVGREGCLWTRPGPSWPLNRRWQPRHRGVAARYELAQAICRPPRFSVLRAIGLPASGPS